MILVIPAEDDLTVTVVLPTGVRDHDAATAAALAPLAHGVLTGAPGTDGTPLADLLAGHGAVVRADVGHETLTFQCRMPAAAVADCLPLFLTAVTRPALGTYGEVPGEAPGEEPCAARTRLRELLFGEHPLARPTSRRGGAPASGRGGTPDLSAVHRDVMASGAPVVVVAGPETLVPQALGVLEAPEGSLPESAPGSQAVMKREAPPMETVSSGGVNLRAAGAAARARVAAGGITAARRAPASAAARVLAELFGPGDASLLRSTLYTDIGIDCELEATYEGYQDCGLWQTRLDLDTDWVATAESLVRELLEFIASGRLDEAAFQAARAAARERAGAEASDVPLASYRAALAALDGGEPEDLVLGVGRVTPGELASAAARVLRTYAVAVV
ncbi:insulinase family protein [Streptomyces sp. NPDC046197]|uniref:insulinase family protein n=1 Tax=Streptomyces sp. NPDC046197 TaxID=3154337 RepID=UPI0033FE905B